MKSQIMSNQEIRIDEFRLGMTAQACGDSWRSTGFYGDNYMGVTFEGGQIPPALQIATAPNSPLFKVSQYIDYQSFNSLSPQEKESIGSLEFNEQWVKGVALVGRIIDEWSILAVITVALDFANRPFPVQRYFCCRESFDGSYDGMATLIRFYASKAEDLIFDLCENKPATIHLKTPFETQKFKRSQTLHSQPSKFRDLYLLQSNIEQTEVYLLALWKTCLDLVDDNREQAAWAFNVHELTSPNDFTLIRAGTQHFFNNYYRVSNSLVHRGNTNNIRREIRQKNHYALEAQAIFDEFITTGKLDSEQINFIKTDIQQNLEQWRLLAQRDRDDNEEQTERFKRNFFQDYFHIIRYFTLSALILPERAADLFQQLLVSKNEIWDEFWECQEPLRPLQVEPYFKKSAQIGVWLIINYIIEDKFQLPSWRLFKLDEFRGLPVETKFFVKSVKKNANQKQNIWTTHLGLSLTKLINVIISYTPKAALKDITNREIKSFLRKLSQETYRKKHKKAYSRILKIFSQAKFKHHLFLQALIERELKNKINYRLYDLLKRCKYDAGYPKFFNELVKEKTLSEQTGTIILSIVSFVTLPVRFLLKKRKSRSQKNKKVIRRPNYLLMRNWLYFIIGLLASVLGWSISQILLVDLNPIWEKLDFTVFSQFPYLVKFVIITSSLAISMVMAEVFLSHPTRLKQGWEQLKLPLLFAIILSILGAMGSGIMSFILQRTSVPAEFIRLFDWLIIGTTIGLAEGTTWLFRSFSKLYLTRKKQEKDDVAKVIKHFIMSVGFGLAAGVFAFFVSEQNLETDLYSFILLGSLLGVALSFSTSPNRQLALKLGYGFERIAGTKLIANRLNGKTYKNKGFKFVYDPRNPRPRRPILEEGLSIQLPKKGDLVIGSDVEQADIIVNDLPRKSAIISVSGRKATIEPGQDNILEKLPSEIVIKPLKQLEEENKENPFAEAIPQNNNDYENFDTQSEITSSDMYDDYSEYESYAAVEELKHNTVITLYTNKNTEQRRYVRFVFYDRFLDPEA